MIELFNFEQSGVRVVMLDGEPWFVAADVCAVLGYSNARAAIAQHCKGVAKHDIPTSSGVQAVTIIPERDLYRLVMRSKLPNAERFEEWVVSEILPTIRKTGSYGTELTKALDDPASLRKLLLDNVEKVLALQGEVEAARPKVHFYDKIIDVGDTVGFREACKIINTATGAKEPEVRNFFFQAKWIQRLGGRLSPAHYGQSMGYVTVREREVIAGDSNPMVIVELRITQRGIARAIERISASEAAE